jgi:hypothetical protein
MSERYKDKNYLFLHPFDLSQTPGYTDVVQKLMDLGTLSSNLESGAYATWQDFFQDACRIFENAVAYHANRERKWITFSDTPELFWRLLVSTIPLPTPFEPLPFGSCRHCWI